MSTTDQVCAELKDPKRAEYYAGFIRRHFKVQAPSSPGITEGYPMHNAWPILRKCAAPVLASAARPLVKPLPLTTSRSRLSLDVHPTNPNLRHRALSPFRPLSLTPCFSWGFQA